MSLKNKTELEKNHWELEFTIDRPAFDAAVDKQFKANAKKITIPGFRKGKAPRAVIEKIYGKGVFYDDAVNDIIPDAYKSAVDESGFTPVSRPDLEIASIDENGVAVKAKIWVKPEVEIADYFGIPATKYLPPVTDEEIDAELQRYRERNSRMIEVDDRAAEMGDTVTIDYEGSVDGVPFDGGKAEGHNLKLGSGYFIPGFEEQIVGHNIGDEFDVNVTFPEKYHEESLAGKPAVFKTKLHKIQRTELPALDDEFAKDVSEFDTLDAFKEDIKKKAVERKEKTAESGVEEQLIDALIEKLVADIPESMFENETENFLRDYDTRLRMQGLDLANYLRYTGMDLDALRAQFRPQAERQVKTRLALEKIAALENIAPTDEEIEAEYDRLAKAYGMEIEKVKEFAERESIVADLKVKGAVDLVKAKAQITVTDKAPEHKHDDGCDCDECHDHEHEDDK